MASNVSFTLPGTEYQAEAERIARQRKMAEQLRMEAEQGTPLLPGQFHSPLSGIARLLKAHTAKTELRDADAAQKGLGERRNTALADVLRDMPRARREALPTDQEGTGSFDMSGTAGPQTNMVQPSMADNAQWLGKLQAIGPEATQLGGTILGMQQRTDENAAGREARMQERLMVLDAQAQQATLSREERAARAAEAATLRREMQASQQAFADQQARQAAADRRALALGLAGMRQEQRPPVSVIGPDGKPVLVSPDQAVGRQPAGKGGGSLPTAALKMQNEALEEIGLAGAINSDLGAIGQQLKDGKLDLGLVNNAVSQARNFIGASSEQSRNFSSFQATLEKLRNDSLRLNKGVQTEGDAQRAWNELFKSINDPQVVSQRLAEIQKINQRGADMKKMQLDITRANFGLDPLDTSGAFSQPAAVGTGGPAATPKADPLGIRKK